MFNGRNRFNGFTTGKPVCVLRLDSAGTEVKRKNRALEIPHKLLIIKVFLLLTEAKTAVLKGCFGRRRAVFCSLNFCHPFELCQCWNGRQQEPPRARGAENGRRSNYLRAVRYSTPKARFSHRGGNCRFPIKFMAISQGRNAPLSRRWHGDRAWISPVCRGFTRTVWPALTLSDSRREPPLATRARCSCGNADFIAQECCYCFLASKGIVRLPPSRADVPFKVSPSSVPSYFVVMLPLGPSVVVEKLNLAPSSLPSATSA
jgi:hypothetical protein